MIRLRRGKEPPPDLRLGRKLGQHEPARAISRVQRRVRTRVRDVGAGAEHRHRSAVRLERRSDARRRRCPAPCR